MDVFKKLVVSIIATIAAAVLIVWSFDSFGFRSPMFAFLVNWIVMSWVAIAGQSVDFTLPARYYDIRPFERTGQVYEGLGIRLFKRLVRRGPLSIFSPTLRFPPDKSISALHHLEHAMRRAETGHVVIFVLVFGFISYAFFRGWFDAVAWMLALNVVINGYPIMLQRYNRIKLQESISRHSV